MMKLNQHRIWQGLILGCLMLGVLAGCSQKSQSSSANRQVLRLAAQAPLDTIDLAKAGGYGQTGNVYESFYRLGKNGQVAPGLAQKVQVSADGKTYTFTLRPHLRWSNGDALTAKDFVYSWRRTINPKTAAQYAYLFSGIKNANQIVAGKAAPSSLGISAPNQRTVVVTLNKPVAYFKLLMAYPLFAPQNERIVKKYGARYATTSQYMVYSGPFKIENWTGTGNKWRFVKNPYYWDKKVVKLNQIDYQVVESTNTGLELYQQNKLDLTLLSNQQVKNYKNNQEFRQYPYSYVNFIKWNFQDQDATAKKIITNRDFRLGVSLALNRDALTRQVLGDGSRLPTGIVAGGLAKNPKTGVDFAKEQQVSGTLDYNQAEAKQYYQAALKATGLSSVKLTLLYSSDDATDSIVAQYLKGQLEKVLPHFTLSLKTMPGKGATTYASQGKFDLFLSGWGADFNDPISFLQIPLSNTSYNQGKYSNKTYDTLISRAENEDANQPTKRWQDLVAASRLLNQEQGITPLYQANYAYLQKATVKGIIHNTAGTQWSYKYAYMK